MVNTVQPSLSGLVFSDYITRQFLPGYFHAPLPGLLFSNRGALCGVNTVKEPRTEFRKSLRCRRLQVEFLESEVDGHF